MANELDCNIIASGFKLQSSNYSQFQIYMIIPPPYPAMG